MNKRKIVIAILVVVAAWGVFAYLLLSRNKNVSLINNKTTQIVDSSILYNNIDYGFSFSLPLNWKGYSIVENTWEGNPLITSNIKETGPKLLIRNPKWTVALPYEDIPIMIFTLKQWDSYLKEDFSVGAAPIAASELARNNSYVFVLPARWNFDYSKGFEEAESILKSNPIKVFDVAAVSSLKDGRQCYTYNHEATKTEPYTVNELLDMTIKRDVVNGTKNGTQNGPDLTNGYTGNITGTLSGDTITAILSYVVEGSSGKEKEIYRGRKDQIGIEKLRYPLIEKSGMLVPDTTKEFRIMLYSRVDCTASN